MSAYGPRAPQWQSKGLCLDTTLILLLGNSGHRELKQSARGHKASSRERRTWASSLWPFFLLLHQALQNSVQTSAQTSAPLGYTGSSSCSFPELLGHGWPPGRSLGANRILGEDPVFIQKRLCATHQLNSHHAVNTLLLLDQPSPLQPWSPMSCGMTSKRTHLMAHATGLVPAVQGFPVNTQVQDARQQVSILTGSPGRAHQDTDHRPAGSDVGSRPLNAATAMMGLAFQGAVERARYERINSTG